MRGLRCVVCHPGTPFRNEGRGEAKRVEVGGGGREKRDKGAGIDESLTVEVDQFCNPPATSFSRIQKGRVNRRRERDEERGWLTPRTLNRL